MHRKIFRPQTRCLSARYSPTERIGMTAKRAVVVVPEYTGRQEMCCSD